MGALAKTSLVPGPGTLNLKLGEGNANESQSIRCKIQLINEFPHLDHRYRYPPSE